MTIKEICEKYKIKNYTINGDTVDVKGDVSLVEKNLTKLPLKFGTVTGYFDCSFNELTSLEGAPKKVKEGFYCHNNKLMSLESGPERVGGSFTCHNNKLVSLHSALKKVGRYFDCSGNNLTSLKGAPKEVDDGFYCYDNNLTSKLQCARIDADRFITDFGRFQIPKDKHEKIKWIFDNDN